MTGKPTRHSALRTTRWATIWTLAAAATWTTAATGVPQTCSTAKTANGTVELCRQMSLTDLPVTGFLLVLVLLMAPEIRNLIHAFALRRNLRDLNQELHEISDELRTLRRRL